MERGITVPGSILVCRSKLLTTSATISSKHYFNEDKDFLGMQFNQYAKPFNFSLNKKLKETIMARVMAL